MSTPSSSFTQKVLEISITLADGTTFADKSNTVVLTGLRMQCEVKKMGHPAKPAAKVKIYGMSQDLMNQCTVIPATQTTKTGPLKNPAIRKVYLRVRAGDENIGLNQVFTGDITSAYSSYHSPPNMYFQIEATSGAYPVRLPVKPRSYEGGVRVEQIIEDICSSIGYGFQNNGYSGVISNPYLTGSPIEQMRQVAAAVSSTMEFQIDDQAVYISPKNVARIPKGQVPLISAQTGMKEYPIFDKHGLKVETLYNPNVVIGGGILVKSDIKDANGYWLVNGLSQHLECNNPHGQWLTRISANNAKHPASLDVGE